MMSSLGTRLERLRIASGLSARQLDKLAGLQAGHTRFIERNAGDRVAARTVAQIAAVFGTSMDWLFTGAGSEPATRTVRKAVARALEIHDANGATKGC